MVQETVSEPIRALHPSGCRASAVDACLLSQLEGHKPLSFSSPKGFSKSLNMKERALLERCWITCRQTTDKHLLPVENCAESSQIPLLRSPLSNLRFPSL